MVFSKRLLAIPFALVGAVWVSTTCPVQAASLETFVMGTTGQSNWSTYGVPTPVYDNFGVWGGSIPTNPAGLAASGIAGTTRLNNSAAAASLTDSITAGGSGLSAFGAWTYSGSSRVNVNYGKLGSESHAIHTGNGDNMTVNNAESYGIMHDSLNPTSPGVIAGVNGTMRLAVTVDGMMKVSGKGTVGMMLRYGFGAPMPVMDKTLLETFVDIYGNGVQTYGPHSSFGSFVTPPGMAFTYGPNDPSGLPSSIEFGGATTVYATVPITFGGDTDFRMGMMTWVNPGNGSGILDTGFGQTATITGIELFDNLGQSVPEFTISSGSGTLYTASGVQVVVVPEAGTLALLIAGASIGLIRIRARQGAESR